MTTSNGRLVLNRFASPLDHAKRAIMLTEGPVFALKGQGNLAQGFPWEGVCPSRPGPEGPAETRRGGRLLPVHQAGPSRRHYLYAYT